MKNQRKFYTEWSKRCNASGSGQDELDKEKAKLSQVQRHAVRIFEKHYQGLSIKRQWQIFARRHVSILTQAKESYKNQNIVQNK